MLEAQSTSALYWTATLVTALIDVVYIGILVWLIKPPRFQRLMPAILVVSAIFWCALYTAADLAFWNSCYAYVFPSFVREIVPIYGLLTGLILAPLFYWLALRLPGHPVLVLSLLGGIHSLPGHAWGIYGRGLLERCPLLTEVNAASALVFGIFEFVFYWCVIVTFAATFTVLRERLRTTSRRGPNFHQES